MSYLPPSGTARPEPEPVQPSDLTHETRRDAGLTEPDLWLRYFGLGGMRTAVEVESYLRGVSVPSDRDHDVLAQALNERFTELGRNHPVPYAGGGR